MPWSSLKKKYRNYCPPITQLTPTVSVSIRRSGKDRPWPASCARFSIRSTPQQRSHARRFTNGNHGELQGDTNTFPVKKIVGKIGYPLYQFMQKSITRGFTQIDPYRLYMFIQVPTSIWSVPLEVLRQKLPKHRLTLGRRTKTSHQK